MKKNFAFIGIVLTFAFVLCGCSNGVIDKDADQSISHSATVLYHADWPYYGTSEELVSSVSEVFEGEIVDISFAVIDIKTGELADEASKKENAYLYTIYEIQPTWIYKGTNSETKFVAIMGGIDGYREETQVDTMKKSGLIEKYDCIPLLDNSTVVESGKTYLFLAHDYGNQYLRVPNPEQFAFTTEESTTATEDAALNYSDIRKYLSVEE